MNNESVHQHHCRRCGQVFCNSCCDNRLPLPRFAFVDPVRQCGPCSIITKKENEFFNKHLKAFLNGGTFTVSVNDNEPELGAMYICKLTPDHKTITFEGGNATPVDSFTISSIKDLEILLENSNDKAGVPIGIVVTYYGTENQVEKVKLLVAATPNKKQSIAWIIALQKSYITGYP
ncbi:uncharacterized protein TRIADDRAFT_62050 [Trichoplax adhaerens]|uniref:FYVE-type domain-containing protein n=1 Tax=Trichoplax adhaerens TaxID=10228 RepID=B3SCP5_TRIAD|nr:hypothetical protein TRIADDRAFT_62050 [Trichoplax adhaerens]EDV19488.1 hypothetical protein TRIADDRAFT_62050 [Trichoplax adhaerens]|eukprot:XP_002118005.1 hypothetical protein TRIADDRAFT_62050 [Trichoplax adhaerens]